MEPGGKSMARPEFRDECDINNILRRYGAGSSMQGKQRTEVIDDRLDLQTALTALAQAREANFNVPEELRHKYPTWRHVLTAAERGDYQNDLVELAARQTAEKAENEKLAKDRQDAELYRAQQRTEP